MKVCQSCKAEMPADLEICESCGTKYELAKRRGGFRGGLFVLALVILLAIGALGYRLFFSRNGEEAARLLPTGCWMVITIDTNPSPTQANLFLRISDAMKREGLDKQTEDLLSSVLGPSKLATELRPYINNSLALGMWGSTVTDTSGAVILNVTNAKAVASILNSKNISTKDNGVTIYKAPDSEIRMALEGSNLIMAVKPSDIHKVLEVKSGKVISVVDTAEFKEARKTLPEDASLMIFVQPSGVQKVQQSYNPTSVMESINSTAWCGVGLTMRDDGLLVTGRMPSGVVKGLEGLNDIQALRYGPLQAMPSGAYGFYTLSQPSKFWEVIRVMMAQNPEAAKQIDQGLADFDQTSGLSFAKDVLPAFAGEAALAIYPSTKNNKNQPEMMLVLDSSNNATPGQLVAKLTGNTTALLMLSNVAGYKLTSAQEEGIKVYKFNNPTMKDMAGEFTCAQIGDKLVITTSGELLTRAIGCKTSPTGSLAQEPTFQKMMSHGVNGAQILYMINFPSMITAITQADNPTDKPNEASQAWIDAFKDTAVVSGSVNSKEAFSEAFIPVDWEHLVHAMALANKQAPTPPTPSGGGTW